jgi:NAD(P)-dependent dehydrogenase (short-subunit alcohol dehydrogenase family)
MQKVDESTLDSMKIFHPELMAGKVILITGGSNGGMLKDMARAYLMHKAAAVVLMSRNAEKL